MDEERLTGGRVTADVVRRGCEVHRTRSANAIFVRRVLQLLEREGAEFAPRYLGEDELGREVLTFMPGLVPDNIGCFSDEQCVAAMRLIRRLHALTAGMDGCAPGQVVCHNDLSPCNFTFVDGLPVSIIDWDAAAIGAPECDVGYALWMWLDIGSPEQDASEVARRFQLMLAAYGAPGPDWRTAYAAMLGQMRRVGASVFPTEAQTRATSNWAQACLDWSEARLKSALEARYAPD